MGSDLSGTGRGKRIALMVTAGGLVLLLIAVLAGFPAEEYAASVGKFVQGLGPWGVPVFFTIYIAWILCTLPGMPLAILAGALFGPWLGGLYALCAASLATSASFLIGRTVARERILHLCRRYPRLARLEETASENALYLLALLRLAPVFPISLLNYGLGATRMRFWVYFSVSFLLLLPGAMFYAGVGEALKQLLGQHSVSGELIVRIIFLGVFLGVVVWLIRRQVIGRGAPCNE